MSMKAYRSHKRVWAVKLADVLPANESGFGLLIPENTGDHQPWKIGGGWLAKHNPQQQPDGSYGYFVVYDDGYESWSPSQAFEAGYTLIAD
jgi:hypothetical protein